MTPLGGEHHAGRAAGRRMAIMLWWMLAAVRPRTGSLADGLLGAAWHRRINDLGAALTVQLLEAAAIARRTVATMTGLIAFMPATAERAIAGQRAGVIDIDAALGIALVLATAALLGAATLAARIVRTGRQLAALDHLIHVAATALDRRLLGARRALAQVAFAGALMRMRRFAAAQRFAADALAGGHRIQATGALRWGHRQLAAGAAGDLCGTQLAGTTGAGMAGILAFMIAAGQRFAAALLARIAALILAFAGALHLALLLAAMAMLLHLLRARLTLARMARLLAAMLAAVEQLVANGLTLQRLLHGALHQLGGASAAAAATDIRLAWRTRTGMAEQRARMAAALNTAAQLATAVG